MKTPKICKDCMYSINKYCKQIDAPISLIIREKACGWVESYKKRNLED